MPPSSSATSQAGDLLLDARREIGSRPPLAQRPRHLVLVPLRLRPRRLIVDEKGQHLFSDLDGVGALEPRDASLLTGRLPGRFPAVAVADDGDDHVGLGHLRQARGERRARAAARCSSRSSAVDEMKTVRMTERSAESPTGRSRSAGFQGPARPLDLRSEALLVGQGEAVFAGQHLAR